MPSYCTLLRLQTTRSIESFFYLPKFIFLGISLLKVNRFVVSNATAIQIQDAQKNRCPPICPLIVRKQVML